jgi:hypothetical protein
MRPQDGQLRRLRLSSSAFFASPAFVISQAIAATTAIEIVMWRSGVIVVAFSLPPGVGVGLVIELAPPPIGYVRVELCRA